MSKSQLAQERQHTRETIQMLLDDGSNPDADYTIEHHFSGSKFDALEKAAVDIFKLGFEVTDAEELLLDDGGAILCFDAVTESQLDEAQIMEQIEQLLTVVAKHKIQYDGWGTYFQE